MQTTARKREREREKKEGEERKVTWLASTVEKGDHAQPRNVGSLWKLEKARKSIAS